MNQLYVAIGVALLVAAVVDLLWTTLWLNGRGGPLSSRLIALVWKGVSRLGHGRSRWLTLSGPLTVVASLALWVGMVLAGWTLLFAGGDPSILDTRAQEPVGWIQYAYYVAYTVFTLGNGDFTPVDGGWQIATGLMAGSGMLLITLVMTYVLSVLQAVNQKRSFAVGVTGLGQTSESLVRTGWNDRNEDFRDLHVPLTNVSSQLDQLTQQHLSFPIIHYYRSKKRESSVPVAVVALSETLLVLQHGIEAEYRPNGTLLTDVRSSVQNYIEVLEESGVVDSADEDPPIPDLDALREAGIPTVSDEEFADALEDQAERRRKLYALLDHSEFDWPRGSDGV